VLLSGSTNNFAEEDFVALINGQGAAKATEYFREFRKNNPDVILFQRKTINNLGWQKASQGILMSHKTV